VKLLVKKPRHFVERDKKKWKSRIMIERLILGD
jgi:hypothetical protein